MVDEHGAGPEDEVLCLGPTRDADLLISPEPGWLLNYCSMVMLAGCIAALGMRLDSAPIVIGAMLVAPVMRPVLGVAFVSLVRVPREVMGRLGAVLAGTSVGLVGLGYAIARIVPSTEIRQASEVLSRTAPDLRDFLVALAAGAVGAFAMIRPRVADTIPGVAIAVALVPPPVAAGLSFGGGFSDQATGALLLYGTNLVAIVAGAMATALFLAWHGSMPARIEVRRLLVGGAIVALIGAVLSASLWAAFDDAVSRARSERDALAVDAAARARQTEAERVIGEWLVASSEPNLDIVSIDLPPAGDDGDADRRGTLSLVLLGRTESLIPDSDGLDRAIGDAIGQELVVSIRLVAVSDQTNTAFVVERSQSDDGESRPSDTEGAPQLRAVVESWLASGPARWRILSIGPDDREETLIHVALDGPAPPLDTLDDLLADAFTDPPPVAVVTSDLRTVATQPETRGEGPDELVDSPTVLLVVDGRALQDSTVCSLADGTGYRAIAGTLFVHVDDELLIVTSPSSSESTSSFVIEELGDERRYRATFEQDAPVDLVEVVVTGTPDPCIEEVPEGGGLLAIVGVAEESNLRVRLAPTVESPIVGAYPVGDDLVVATGIESTDDEGRRFLAVELGLTRGWIAASFTEPSEAEFPR